MTTRTKNGGFEEKLEEVIGVSDSSRDSKCGLIGQFLASVLSSKQLYKQVAIREKGLALFSAYLDDWKLHFGSLGLATGSQLLDILERGYVLNDALEIKSLKKNELILVDLIQSTVSAYDPTIDSLITSKTSLEYSSFPTIKKYCRYYGISPKILERRIFEVVRNIDSDQLF